MHAPPSIAVEITDAVAVIALNRPAQRNAMSAPLVAELIAALNRHAADPAIKAIVLTGAGAGFCAGSDLLGLSTMSAAERSAFEAESARLAQLITRLDLPVVAAVHGFAIGGGLTLAAACDIVVTEPQAKWSLPEVPIGLFPAWGLQPVEDRIGRKAARRLAWGIDTLDGAEALALGLADQLCESPALAAAQAIAQKLAALPRAQSVSVKHYFAARDDSEEADSLANMLFMRATETPEAQQCFRTFAAKARQG